MNVDTADIKTVLLRFPKQWDRVRVLREQIMNSSGPGEAYHHCQFGYGHSDNTLRKAMRLAELDTEKELLKKVREWLSIGLAPEDRVFLICVWRGRTMSDLDRDIGQIGGARKRLQELVNELSHFVGHACVEHGPASAATPRKHLQGLSLSLKKPGMERFML